MAINWREPSTKRGMVWIVGGGIVVWQTLHGQAVDADAILNRIDTWIGVAMTIAGLFGLLPDAPPAKKEAPREHEALPPIVLQAQPECLDPDQRVFRPPLPAGSGPESRPVEDADRTPSDERPGWNG